MKIFLNIALMNISDRAINCAVWTVMTVTHYTVSEALRKKTEKEENSRREIAKKNHTL